MKRCLARFRVQLPILALLLACSDSTSPSKAGPPAEIVVTTGNAQQAVVGSELSQPLEVRVVDARGRPVVGQLINFRVVSGGGSVFGGGSNTDDRGIARERWTLGPAAGEQTLEARAVNNA